MYETSPADRVKITGGVTALQHLQNVVHAPAARPAVAAPAAEARAAPGSEAGAIRKDVHGNQHHHHDPQQSRRAPAGD